MGCNECGTVVKRRCGRMAGGKTSQNGCIIQFRLVQRHIEPLVVLQGAGLADDVEGFVDSEMPRPFDQCNTRSNDERVALHGQLHGLLDSRVAASTNFNSSHKSKRYSVHYDDKDIFFDSIHPAAPS